MKILYIHGHKAKFDLNAPKVKLLSTIGEVVGKTVDYDIGKDIVERELIAFAIFNDVELIVGTSMGGYFANIIGNLLDLPFVMINPAIDIEPIMFNYGYGMLLLDKGDDVLDAEKARNKYHNVFKTKFFQGGNHSFEHLDKCLDDIVDYYEYVDNVNQYEYDI